MIQFFLVPLRIYLNLRENPCLKKTIETITEFLMVSTTNTITNIAHNQLLTIKTFKKRFPVVCFWHMINHRF